MRAGRLAYLGVSAGAALAGPDLAYFSDDGSASREDWPGLGLVPFTVLAHRDRGRQQSHDRHIADSPPGAFFSVRDDQAIIVHGDTHSVAGSASVPRPTTHRPGV